MSFPLSCQGGVHIIEANPVVNACCSLRLIVEIALKIFKHVSNGSIQFRNIWSKEKSVTWKQLWSIVKVCQATAPHHSLWVLPLNDPWIHRQLHDSNVDLLHLEPAQWHGCNPLRLPPTCPDELKSCHGCLSSKMEHLPSLKLAFWHLKKG